MKIRDIVNRDIVNLTNCEHEPIHIPGSIQPHGFLLSLNQESWKIDFCSQNTESFIGISYTDLLGKTFEEIFGKENADALQTYVRNDKMRSLSPLKIELAQKLFQCTIHHSGNQYIVEAEPDVYDTQVMADAYNQTLQFVAHMNNTSTLKDLAQLVAKSTRDITGYDRVMVYRFDKEYNGEVFAESCVNRVEPFLGLHYPHTDIPPQARELYMKNLLRLIADINYTPVPLYTIDDQPEKNLDLSLSVLRSTSPIHVEYLQNMGVGATLTISLIHRDRLWGLIACHHYSPKNLTPEIRLAAQLQGQFITSQIDIRQSNEEYEISRKTNIALEKLTSLDLPPVAESFKIISINPDLLRLCNAAGVSLLIGGTVYKNGITPSDDAIKKLSDWMAVYSNNNTFHTDKLINFVPDHKNTCDVVSGIIYHSLGNNNSIIWYRQETLTEVNWAGNPEKAILRDSKGLHPRNSFNLWKQIIKCRSKDWMQPELNAAANYAHTLQKQIGMLLLSQEEERSRNLNEVLRETNAELENINWISTHDLQEPLRKIQLISSKIMSQEEMSPNTVDALERMNNSANRMQILLGDILKYTRIKHTEDAFEAISLDNILSEVLQDISEALREHVAVVEKGSLPVVNGVSFLLKQLFSNIILNSLKYSDTERKPIVKITTEPIQLLESKNSLFHCIQLSDNGIGFQQQYADSIFNIFTRLHGVGQYKGSGVGLALCKKIMQMHGGTIEAMGTPGEGATFRLYFPVQTKS